MDLNGQFLISAILITTAFAGKLAKAPSLIQEAITIMILMVCSGISLRVRLLVP